MNKPIKASTRAFHESKRMVEREVKRWRFYLVLGLLIAWFIILFTFGPTKIIASLGVNNSYVALFIIAATGGVSVFSGYIYFSFLGTLAATGLNPFLLGLLGGVGVSIGDSLFYFLGKQGRYVIPVKIEKAIDNFRAWLNKKTRWSIPLFVFAYAAFTPFPNEFMTISVGLTGTRFRRLIIPLILGNIFITTIIALGIQYLANVL